MGLSNLIGIRLSSHNISKFMDLEPEQVVSRRGAIQAQDYSSALWAIGLRCKKQINIRDVERCIEEARIVRTWLNRGTLHFSSSSDTRWMLNLFSPGFSKIASARDSNLGLSPESITEVKRIFEVSLKDRAVMTRAEMYETMESAGIATRKGNMGYHLLYRAAWDGLICFGPQRGREQTFVKMDRWLPESSGPKGEDALAALSVNYFSSHGPATVRDFAWWSGQKMSDCRIALEDDLANLVEYAENSAKYYMAEDAFPITDLNRVDLLPAFDEYLVGYSDRKDILDGHAKEKVIHQNGIFRPVILVGGKVAGTWTAKHTLNKVLVKAKFFSRVDSGVIANLKEAAHRYGNFMEKDATAEFSN